MHMIFSKYEVEDTLEDMRKLGIDPTESTGVLSFEQIDKVI
jgi:hypothetical protein